MCGGKWSTQIQGSALLVVSGVHWGSGDMSPMDREATVLSTKIYLIIKSKYK